MTSDGFAYLELFVEAIRGEARVLGPWPTVASVRSFMKVGVKVNNRPHPRNSQWSGEKFSFGRDAEFASGNNRLRVSITKTEPKNLAASEFVSTFFLPNVRIG
jgi:hypothetical protein